MRLRVYHLRYVCVFTVHPLLAFPLL